MPKEETGISQRSIDLYKDQNLEQLLLLESEVKKATEDFCIVIIDGEAPEWVEAMRVTARSQEIDVTAQFALQREHGRIPCLLGLWKVSYTQKCLDEHCELTVRGKNEGIQRGCTVVFSADGVVDVLDIKFITPPPPMPSLYREN